MIPTGWKKISHSPKKNNFTCREVSEALKFKMPKFNANNVQRGHWTTWSNEVDPADSALVISFLVYSYNVNTQENLFQFNAKNEVLFIKSGDQSRTLFIWYFSSILQIWLFKLYVLYFKSFAKISQILTQYHSSKNCWRKRNFKNR